ncbi:MAG: hypothetical protein ACKOWQ_01665 [Aquirufa sp.]
MNNYLFFGQWIISEFVLPEINSITDNAGLANPILLKYGKVPLSLEKPATEEKPFSTFNENEFLYQIPEIAKYYIRKGNEIIIEPISENETEVLLFFYSNALAAVLYQRNLIPFHASGVKINDKQIVLFPAPSRTGKSTTAIFLEKKGYPIFSDDTVLLEVKDGKCYATPSYPIMRLWQNSIEESEQYETEDGYELRPGMNKFGISFGDKYSTDKMEVAALVFLNNRTEELKIESLKSKNVFLYLGNNVYRKQWIIGMKKQITQFQLVSAISQKVPAFIANRPKGEDTFQSFSNAIEQEIIAPLNGNK